MLARQLRQILLFQAIGGVLLYGALVWLAGVPWWLGLALFTVLPWVLTYAWMLRITLRACVGQRRWSAIVRAAVGEAWCTYRLLVLRLPWAWGAPQVQLGRGTPARVPVVLVHGYLCNHRIWDDLVPRLRQRGHTVVALDLEPVFASIDDYAAGVQRAVEGLCTQTGAPKVALVGHSMGGLAIRAWMRAYGSDRVARVLTLGTPHQGTQVTPYARTTNGAQMRWQSPWLAELARTESASLRSLFRIALAAQDAIVYPQSAQVLAGVTPTVFEGLGHVQLCSAPTVLAWVVAQLDWAAPCA